MGNQGRRMFILLISGPVLFVGIWKFVGAYDFGFYHIPMGSKIKVISNIDFYTCKWLLY